MQRAQGVPCERGGVSAVDLEEVGPVRHLRESAARADVHRLVAELDEAPRRERLGKEVGHVVGRWDERDVQLAGGD